VKVSSFLNWISKLPVLEKGVAVRGGRRVAFHGSPHCKSLVAGGFPRSGLDFVADDSIGSRENGVPHAGREIDAPQMALRRLFSKPVSGRKAVIVEQDDIGGSFQDEKRLPFSSFTRSVIGCAGSAVKRMATSLRKPISCVPCHALKAILAERSPASRLYISRMTYSRARPESRCRMGGRW
jgi:hypothetical protein